MQKFSGLTFPETRSTVVWEMRRQAICFSLYTVSQLISELADATAKAISPIDSRDWQALLSADLSRRLASELFAADVPAVESSVAAQKLINYCLHHNTEPSQPIPAELKKSTRRLQQKHWMSF